MREISKKEALGQFQIREQNGDHIDTRVYSAIKNSSKLFLVTLRNKNEFLSLIWQENDGIRILASGGPRTLRDIAQRLLDNSYSFESLATDCGKPKDQHDPEWFAKCLPIDSQFDFSRFSWVVVVHVNEEERNQSPKGSFYIYDGIHKTLVLSKRLLANEVGYEPVEALLILPRPDL